MVSGFGVVRGLAKVKLKIFNLIRDVNVFVIDSKIFSHQFLIGLDLIRSFRLNQDCDLQIS